MAKSLNIWITIIVNLVMLITFIVSGAVKIQRVEDKSSYNEGRVNSIEIRIEKGLIG